MEIQTSFKKLSWSSSEDTLAPYLFITTLDYAMRTTTDRPENFGFSLQELRSRRRPAVSLTDTDFADDIAFRQYH